NTPSRTPAKAEDEEDSRSIPPPAAAAAITVREVAASDFDPARTYRETRELWETDFERRYVSWLLARHGGNLSSAAREAGMDRKYLHKLRKKHGLGED
ncbi:MAG TPA: helix-turn-helix domain-containing protein, partial [Polyangiales bacterium]|nr:helix-turn-helix domain-containing protein [Polyangiales bacterium]